MSVTSADLLGPAGPLAPLLGVRYESRAPQLEMAKMVERTFEHRSRALIEAGTGIGKTFGYLAPAILRAALHGERVLIATNTIALQEQIVEKDAPVLLEALKALLPEAAPRVVLAKGRGNYISLRRLGVALDRSRRVGVEPGLRRSLDVIQEWARETHTGDRSSLSTLERESAWEQVESDAANCLGRRCPRFAECHYQSARRRVERGDLIICNHALFFTDLALRSRAKGFLPEVDHIVLDEAHNVEEIACERFGVSLSESRVRWQLGALFNSRTGRGWLPFLKIGAAHDHAVKRALDLVVESQAQATRLFDAVDAILARGPSRGGRASKRMDAAPSMNELSAPLRALAAALDALRKHAETEDDRMELSAHADRARTSADELDILLEQRIEGCVYWAEHEGGAERRDRRIRLVGSPIEAGPVLRDTLWGGERGVALTSATLTTSRGSFEHLQKRLGVEDAETRVLGSPFDHANQMEVVVDVTAPAPAERDRLDELSRRISAQIERSGGATLVLFTSVATMRAVSERVRPALEAQGHALLVQDMDGPRTQLLEAFRAGRAVALFGVASYWQGVDAPGEALRTVVITQLPFEPPDRPLAEARLRRIEEQGGNPFREETLPRALVRFRQGVGRLIRSSSDRGTVVILDPRVVSRSYGRAFLEALPEGAPVRLIEPDPWDAEGERVGA